MNERADEVFPRKTSRNPATPTCLTVLRATVHCFADKPFLLKRMIISTLSIVGGQDESRSMPLPLSLPTILAAFAFYIPSSNKMTKYWYFHFCSITYLIYYIKYLDNLILNTSHRKISIQNLIENKFLLFISYWILIYYSKKYRWISQTVCLWIFISYLKHILYINFLYREYLSVL